MKEIIKRVPVPAAGLMLALAALGNLLQSYSVGVRYGFGLLSTCLLVLLLAKTVLFGGEIKTDLQNPALASVAPTFSMGVLLLSGYLVQWAPAAATALWYLGLALHAGFIVYFTAKFAAKRNMQQVFPSWFIVYVGIVAASVTAPAFGQTGIGRIAFWFGFICYLPLLAIVSYRVLVVKNIPAPLKPLGVIFAAPAALCLVGYLSSFEAKNLAMVTFLAVLSQALYLAVLFIVPGILRGGFFPSYSALTFPLVISAISLKQTNAFLMKAGMGIGFLRYLVLAETVIAVAAVLYVLVKYIQFLLRKPQPSAGQQAAAQTVHTK